MLSDLIVDVFAARVVPMSPAVHDSVVALSSHIPHLLAGSLAGAVADADLRDAVLGLAAGSFRDGTRVAGTPAGRTADMLLRQPRAGAATARPGDRVPRRAGRRAARPATATALVGRFQRGAGPAYRRCSTGRPARPPAVPAGGDHRAEVEFLLQLGAAGGYLTGCRVDGDRVAYTGHLPATAHSA